MSKLKNFLTICSTGIAAILVSLPVQACFSPFGLGFGGLGLGFGFPFGLGFGGFGFSSLMFSGFGFGFSPFCW